MNENLTMSSSQKVGFCVGKPWPHPPLNAYRATATGCWTAAWRDEEGRLMSSGWNETAVFFVVGLEFGMRFWVIKWKMCQRPFGMHFRCAFVHTRKHKKNDCTVLYFTVLWYLELNVSNLGIGKYSTGVFFCWARFAQKSLLPGFKKSSSCWQLPRMMVWSLSITLPLKPTNRSKLVAKRD